MRFSLRVALLTVISAALILGTASLAAAGGKGGAKQGGNHGAAKQNGGGQGAARPESDTQGAVTQQAGGQGAVTQRGGCQIPGLPDPVQGIGTIVLNPAGNTNFTCHGELPAGVEPPDRPTKVDLGECTTQVTPSGQAKTSCHSKP